MLHTIPLESILQPLHGVVSVIGSGGKSTFLREGARRKARLGERTVIATSTHMLAPDDMPLVNTARELAAALAAHRRVCAGTVEESTGKLTAPAIPFAQIARAADLVLVEADGSHRLPLKAHAGHEPTIPRENARTILIVGASGFGTPVARSVHRCERFCALAGCAPDDLATPALVARAIRAEGLVDEDDLVIVNQIDHPTRPRDLEAAAALARALGREVLAGSLRRDALVRLG